MIRYFLSRLLRNVLSIFLFMTALFFTTGALPGDYTYSFLIAPEQREAMQEALGLTRPLIVRYWEWLRHMLTGTLGWSLASRQTVRQTLAEYLPGTLFLFLTATIIAFVIGVSLGKIIAWRRGSAVDKLASIGGVWFYSSFAPLVAVLLVQITRGRLGWSMPPPIARRGLQGAMFVPTRIESTGQLGRIQSMVIYLTDAQSLMMKLLLTVVGSLALLGGLLWITRNVHYWKHQIRVAGTFLIVIAAVLAWLVSGQAPEAGSLLHLTAIPLLTLVLILAGEPMLLMRATMLETVRDEYVIAAQAKGLPDRQVRDQHAARNALLPVLSRVLLSLPLALTGSLVVEAIFSWPGIGSLLLYAADVKDYDVIIGIVAVVGGMVVLAHLLLDILTAVMDPRVRRTAAWKGGE